MNAPEVKRSLVIPVYNCEKQIVRVLQKLRESSVLKHVNEVLIIDNGSSDSTVKKASEALSLFPVRSTIIVNGTNYSLGGSLKRAIGYSLSNHFDEMVVLHGDDQANPEDLINLLFDNRTSSYDLMIGARFHKDSRLSGYSFVRKLGNRVLNLSFRIFIGKKVDDLIAGLNIYRLEYLSDGHYRRFPNNLTFDVHVLLRAAHVNARIQFFPITWSEFDQTSNARIFRQGATIFSLFIKYFLKRGSVFENFPMTNSVPEILPEEIVFRK